MGINIIIPQFGDSSISTMLRTNSNELFEFTANKDSLNSQDTSIKFNTPASNIIKSDSNLTNETDSESIQVKDKTHIIDSSLVINNQHSDSSFFVDWGVFHSKEVIKHEPDSQNTISIQTETIVPNNIDNIIHEKSSSGNDWMTIVIIIILFTAGWIKMSFPRQLSQIFKAAFSFKQANRLFFEQNSLQQKISNVLDILFFLVTSVFISQILDFYNYQFLGLNHSYSSIVLSFIFLGLIYLKIFVYKLTGYLFDNDRIISEYIHKSLIFKKVLSITLLPFIVSIPFVPESIAIWLIQLGVLLYTFFYLAQIIRGIQIIIFNNQSIIYSFLYLCGLEIVPILIIIKIVKLFL